MRFKKLGMVLLISFSITMMSACGSNSVAETISESEEVIVEAPEETVEAEDVDEESEEVDEESVEETDDNSLEEAVAEEKNDVEETADEEENTEPAIDWDDIKELEETVILYAQSAVNVRKGPDTTFDIVGSLAVNDEASVIGESQSSPWKEIKFKDDVAFVHGGYLSAEQVDLEALKAAQDAATLAAAEAAAAQPTPVPAQEPAPAPEPAKTPEAAPTPAPQPTIEQPVGILFIGDSRTCQMKSATGGAGCSWICEYGQSYDWFESTAVPQADKMIGQGTKVVVCMGVNDPNNRNKYASLVNQKAGVWNSRGARVYFVSLNPVAQPYEDKTPRIDDFNATMPGLLSGVTWIDTASTVKQGGYLLVDGIHYDAPGNINIFNLICANLN